VGSKEIIEKLRIDENYYGDFGKQFLSNSDIDSLINNPAMFKVHDESLPLLQGSYFHTALLEPNKTWTHNVVAASTRNTNIYKDAAKESGHMILLQQEADEMDVLVKKLKANYDVYNLLYGDGNVIEEPGVKEIHGEKWKAKRDVGSPKWTIDAKTTADITKFKRNAWVYNYDSQCFVYEEVFEKPMLFIVICKKTHRIGLFTCSDEFKSRGEEKVMDAIIQYRKFYGPDATEDVNNYYTEEEL